MDSPSAPAHRGAYYPVLVRPDAPGRFVAQPLGVPELRAEAASALEAVEEVRRLLAGWPGALYWVPVEGLAPANPLAELAGHARDDPDFEAYLEAIRRYRQEVDARECSSSSSTPTT
jgi:hypothetical protein